MEYRGEMEMEEKIKWLAAKVAASDICSPARLSEEIEQLDDYVEDDWDAGSDELYYAVQDELRRTRNPRC